eukprot:4235588-Prymnesium_polylepis.1
MRGRHERAAMPGDAIHFCAALGRFVSWRQASGYEMGSKCQPIEQSSASSQGGSEGFWGHDALVVRADACPRNKEVLTKASGELNHIDPLVVSVETNRSFHIEDVRNGCNTLICRVHSRAFIDLRMCPAEFECAQHTKTHHALDLLCSGATRPSQGGGNHDSDGKEEQENAKNQRGFGRGIAALVAANTEAVKVHGALRAVAQLATHPVVTLSAVAVAAAPRFVTSHAGRPVSAGHASPYLQRRIRVTPMSSGQIQRFCGSIRRAPDATYRVASPTIGR